MELGGNVIGSIAGSLHLEGEGDTIEVNPIVTSGTKIATITVNEGKPDETNYDLYAPEYTPFSGVYNDLTGKPYLNGRIISGNMYSDNYSADEQVIGTWIDGKPIYQKTIQVSNKTCNSTGFGIDTGLTNVKKIIDEKITVFINQYSEEYLVPYYRASTSEEIIPISYLGSNGVPYLQVKSRGTDYGTCSADVTLLYTKTTD